MSGRKGGWKGGWMRGWMDGFTYYAIETCYIDFCIIVVRWVGGSVDGWMDGRYGNRAVAIILQRSTTLIDADESRCGVFKVNQVNLTSTTWCDSTLRDGSLLRALLIRRLMDVPMARFKSTSSISLKPLGAARLYWPAEVS